MFFRLKVVPPSDAEAFIEALGAVQGTAGVSGARIVSTERVHCNGADLPCPSAAISPFLIAAAAAAVVMLLTAVVVCKRRQARKADEQAEDAATVAV